MYVKRTLAFFLLLPAFAAPPAPESHFGHKIGVDNELLDWDKVVSYFQALEQSSDRIKLQELGKTVEGRPQIAAILSSAANLKNLDHYVDILTRWYRKTRGTPYDGSSPPELYHHYVGHDDNRDWYIFTQPETRNTASLENRWHPEIVYDVHQMAPNGARLFVPSWMDPVDPNIDPILASICNMIGTGVATDLYAAGKTGIAINGDYDFWSPARQYQAYHGGARILTESASARLATPITIRPQDIAENALGYNPRERSWNYLVPWMEGTWHLRDIIDYQEIAWESVLYQAATRRSDLLRYFYQINKDNVERSNPNAFVIPAVQNDPGAARKMLETLAFGDIEIQRAADSFTADGKPFPAGSYVISMHQPFSGWAKTLLEVQNYPDLRLYPGGPPKRPYDVTAQTLPLLMGVDVATVKDSFTANLKPAARFSFELDHPKPLDGWPASDVDSWREVARLWKSAKPVYRDTATGDFYQSPGNGRKEIPAPRIGMYQSYNPSMDEGWTR